MALLKEYDKITVLCGGNFNRRDLVDFEIANAMDVDFLDVMRHRKRWIFFYYVRKVYHFLAWFVFSLTVLLLLLTIAQLVISMGNHISILEAIISNIGVAIISLAGGVLSVILFASSKKFENRDRSQESRFRRALGTEHLEDKNDITKTKDYLQIIKQKYPESAEAYWLPIEGHVSDAQIVPFLTAQAKRNIELAFAGTPYFTEYFADSLCFRVVSGTSGTGGEVDYRIDKQSKQ